MQLSDFHYELPPELIAQYPESERTASRLLCLDGKTGEITHRRFLNIVELLKTNDLLVLNNTKVLNARLCGQKPTGGQIEILVERILSNDQALAYIKTSKTPKIGNRLRLDEIEFEVLGRKDHLFELRFNHPILELLERFGELPLPPYLKRQAAAPDQTRYQTVYAEKLGAIAAPTAGLHFDQALLNKIQQKGIRLAFITLHVGSGTFQPVRVADIRQHVLHKELIEVNAETCELVRETRAQGNRIVAVGTTVVRALETASKTGQIQPFIGETQLFIYPGFEFQTVDVLITNFHLPESSLLMLVCAFAGKEHTLKAYQAAVAARYRFFSYGDAMWVTPQR